MILRDYQENIAKSGSAILKKYNLVYLALEPRVGKTLTSLAIAKEIGALFILFITKKKAKEDIERQAKEFGVGCYVTNYEKLHNLDPIFDLIIADEAHSLGAFPAPSLRTKELKRLCAKCDKVIFLSGTPTPESYSQIYHQFWVSKHSPFKEYANFYKWAKDFVDVKQVMINSMKFNDYKNARKDEIKAKIDHLFITYTQEEAGFEQLVNESILHVKMKPSTYAFANALKRDKIITNKDGESVICDKSVKIMQKLHQIYSGSVIIDEPTREGRVIDYTKAEFIKEHFKGKKIAIFYKFLAELTSLMYVFNDKITFDALHFEDNDDLVFCSQIVSGREGLDLSTADCLIFYNIDFSATSYWQSRARIQTKDRTKKAQIYWIFAHDGIEDKIYKAVQDKKDYTLQYFKKDYNI